jgi:hypothetical protein
MFSACHPSPCEVQLFAIRAHRLRAAAVASMARELIRVAGLRR